MRIALIISIFVILTGCGPPWDTVTSVEGGYSIKMPSIFVTEQMLPVKTAFGSVNYHLLGSYPTRFKGFCFFWSDHGPYLVAHADLPHKSYSEEAMRGLFDHERDRLLGEAKRSIREASGLAKIVVDKPTAFQGHPGRELSIMLSDSRTSHTRMYFIEGRFYILYGVGKNLDTFFNSFKLLTKPGG